MFNLTLKPSLLIQPVPPPPLQQGCMRTVSHADIQSRCPRLAKGASAAQRTEPFTWASLARQSRGNLTWLWTHYLLAPTHYKNVKSNISFEKALCKGCRNLEKLNTTSFPPTPRDGTLTQTNRDTGSAMQSFHPRRAVSTSSLADFPFYHQFSFFPPT